ncbi:MAG: endonuclease Q family protein [bacterium]|nr:endonuclease Q family protein [bacterium]
MKFFADFHIHSMYSRATSRDMRISSIAQTAKIKGLKLMGTGDFTHPSWIKELKDELNPEDGNLFKYGETYFILTTEVNNVYTKNGKLRKIHNIIFGPTFEAVNKINSFLSKHGNLEVDGRPIVSLDSEIMVKGLFEIVPDTFVVPSHVWTPWFSLFGANFGFDSIEECFGNQTSNIFALETGLSSDPPMNWRWSLLDRFALISNSDAHSLRNIGREANCFDCELNYYEIINAIKTQEPAKFKFTVEFFPEEGKYHWDGHRKCGTRISPEEAIANDNICPKCGRPVTVGVMHRVILLADRKKPKDGKIPCKHLIPLHEIISDALGVGIETEKVINEYSKLIHHFGTEFGCLLEAPYEELKTVTIPKIARSICNVREGKVNILPGYDGVYGKVNVSKEKDEEEQQLTLF